MLPRFIFGSRSLILRGGEYGTPLDLGVQFPNLRSMRLPLCISRSRMLARFPDLYDTEEGSNIYKDVTIEAEQICQVSDEVEDVGWAHWIETARGFALEALGGLLGVVRRSGENDGQLRERIKSKIPTMTGGGTIPHLQQLVAPILGCLPANVQVNDGNLENWHGPSYEYILKLNGDALDYEGNHNGTEVGVPTYDTARFGDGLEDPTDANYIYIADDSAFDTDSFAVWTWIHPTDVSGTKYIKSKSDGSNFEWYLRMVGGKLEGKVVLSGTDADVDTGTDLLKVGHSYFVLMSYDANTMILTLFVVEDGLLGEVVRPTEYNGGAGAGSRTILVSAAPIYIGKNIVTASQYWVGWIDHVGYVVDAVEEKLAFELAYAAPGLQHYAHFTIAIINFDTSVIPADDWSFATDQVNKHKAAGVLFEEFSNGPRYEDLDVFDEGHIYHTTEITWTDSLNVTYPG